MSRCAAEIRQRQQVAGATYSILNEHLLSHCLRNLVDAEGGEGKMIQ